MAMAMVETLVARVVRGGGSLGDRSQSVSPVTGEDSCLLDVSPVGKAPSWLLANNSFPLRYRPIRPCGLLYDSSMKPCSPVSEVKISQKLSKYQQATRTHHHTTAEHTTAEQITHANTERATAQRRATSQPSTPAQMSV